MLISKLGPHTLTVCSSDVSESTKTNNHRPSFPADAASVLILQDNTWMLLCFLSKQAVNQQ